MLVNERIDNQQNDQRGVEQQQETLHIPGIVENLQLFLHLLPR
jgi:hypothetical protein